MPDRGLAERLRSAQRRHRGGDPAAALKTYREILGRRPRVPEILILAATAAMELGRLEEAEEFARRSLAARPDGPARLTLGRVLVATGALPEAQQILGAAARDPRVAGDALFSLGEAHRLAGDAGRAEQAHRGAVAASPRHVGAWLALGRLLAAGGSSCDAIDALEKARDLSPRNPRVLAALGRAQLATGNFEEADQAVGEALALDPGAADGLAVLGRLRKTQGRLEEALEAWEQLARVRPTDAGAWTGLAATRQAAGLLEEAGDAYRRGLELAPNDAGLLAARAEWLEWQGRYEEGLASLDGTPPVAGVRLVSARLLRRLNRHEEARRILLEAATTTGLDATLRRQLCFSLGDVADALGRYDEAFGHYAHGNRLVPANWDPSAERAWQERLDTLVGSAGPGDQGREMIFIVGLPRSGTTLIEQILAAHPAVYPGGESAILGRLAHEAASGELPLGEVTLEAVGQRYLNSWPCAARGSGRVTDKMPLNFRYLGLLQGALPGAQIVHCHRDVRDVALSCYATDFIDPALGFSTRIDWLAEYIRFYEEILARWRDRIRVPVLELEYEELAREPAAGIRRLLDFLGLPWADACLDFHRQPRVASTASHAQVREPVHTRSIGRWRRYRTHLGALGDLLERP